MESYKKIIGNKLQKRRIEMGFDSQEVLAGKLGTEQSRVSSWERGINLPEGKHKTNLIELLKVRDDFFEMIELAPETKEHLLGQIMVNLNALNEDQLRSVLGFTKVALGPGANALAGTSDPIKLTK